MKTANILVHVGAVALCCDLAVPAHAQDNDPADQKVVADKAKLAQDLTAIKAARESIIADRETIKADEEQVQKDRASSNRKAVRRDIEELKSA